MATHKFATLVLIVTPSWCFELMVFVPTAFLGSGQCFSYSIFKINPNCCSWHSINPQQHDRSETHWRVGGTEVSEI